MTEDEIRGSGSGAGWKAERGTEIHFSATASAITNAPPPPKHKNNPAPLSGGSSGFFGPDEQRRQALKRGSEVDAQIADAILGLARSVRLLCVTEEQSHLGRCGHIEAVRRRLACGEPGAVLLDGHYVLTEDAHTEELALLHRRLRAIERGEEA